jgi:hypothetical protein
VKIGTCTECGVDQVVVTGVGRIRQHNRIDMRTGQVDGVCPGSGARVAKPPQVSKKSEVGGVSPKSEVQGAAAKQRPLVTCLVCDQKAATTKGRRLSTHADRTGRRCKGTGRDMLAEAPSRSVRAVSGGLPGFGRRR